MLAPADTRFRRRCAGRARGLLAGIAAAALAIGIAGVGVAPASAAEPGVNLATAGAGQIQSIPALGTHWVRLFATWPDLEPTPGSFSPFWLNYYEETLRSLPAGTKVLLDVVNTPSWETGSSNEHTPPVDPQAFAAFVGAIAQRYGTKVSAYEIWNEEDSASWWAGGPDPTAYAQLLKAVYPAIKAANPSATVVLGGLTGNDYEFLEGVYQAGGKGSFDAVGVHTDTACDKSVPVRIPARRERPSGCGLVPGLPRSARGDGGQRR